MAAELDVFNMLNAEYKQKYLDAPNYDCCRHYVLYEFLLNTIPETMATKDKKRHRKELLSKMFACLHEAESLA